MPTTSRSGRSSRRVASAIGRSGSPSKSRIAHRGAAARSPEPSTWPEVVVAVDPLQRSGAGATSSSERLQQTWSTRVRQVPPTVAAASRPAPLDRAASCGQTPGSVRCPWARRACPVPRPAAGATGRWPRRPARASARKSSPAAAATGRAARRPRPPARNSRSDSRPRPRRRSDSSCAGGRHPPVTQPKVAGTSLVPARRQRQRRFRRRGSSRRPAPGRTSGSACRVRSSTTTEVLDCSPGSTARAGCLRGRRATRRIRRRRVRRTGGPRSGSSPRASVSSQAATNSGSWAPS